jgi:hypothetical protein
MAFCVSASTGCAQQIRRHEHRQRVGMGISCPSYLLVCKTHAVLWGLQSGQSRWAAAKSQRRQTSACGPYGRTLLGAVQVQAQVQMHSLTPVQAVRRPSSAI